MKRKYIITLFILLLSILCLSTVSATENNYNNYQESTSDVVTVSSSQQLAETINQYESSSGILDIGLNGNDVTYDLDTIDEFNEIYLSSEDTFDTLTIDGNNNIIKSSDFRFGTSHSKTLVLKNVIFIGNISIFNCGTTKILNCTFNDYTDETSLLYNSNIEYDWSVLDEYNDIPDEIDSEGILEVTNSTFDNVGNVMINDGSHLLLSNNIFKNSKNHDIEHSILSNFQNNVTITENTFTNNNIHCLIDNYYNNSNFINPGENNISIIHNTFVSNNYTDSLIRSQLDNVVIKNNIFINNNKKLNNASLVIIGRLNEYKILDDNIVISSSDTGKSNHIHTRKLTNHDKKLRYVNYKKTSTSDNFIFKHGDKITLSTLCKLFNQDFRNLHLLIYLGDVLVFNGSVDDDLSLLLFSILDNFEGQQILKVIYSDNENLNKTVTREIFIE